MTHASMLHMPLAGSFICADCHSIGNCAECCPACASGSLLELSRILNRPQADAFAGVVVHWRKGWEPR
jgi:hypothetical protein